ncbi:unnamed protein product [Lupinus luteus]|uniref:Tetratricopeptide repeat protein 33 n=1 Tax=Lupinus luteus TaxID=3873 RepID=A0AAV1WFJ7_LUPLU
MKVTWKNNKKKRCLLPLPLFKEKECEDGDEVNVPNTQQPQHQNQSEFEETRHLAKEFQAQGDNLALNGKYREALGKWETAITLAPDIAVLHEQKSQVLLEIGDAWNALKAATQATELEPSWAEAWVTLGRAQLNFGEPDNAIVSFDRALALKPDYEEALGDRKAASNLVKKRKQLHSSGLSSTENRFVVGDKDETS